MRRVAWALCALALAACREAPSPPDPVGTSWPREGTALRLTYSVWEDRAPVWTPDAAHILYVAEEPDPAPTSAGFLVRVPAAGGTYRAALPAGAVVPEASHHTAPALSADGARVAFVDLVGVTGDVCADGSPPACERVDLVYPALRTGVLRVRALAGSAGAADVLLPFAGHGHDPATGIQTLEALPFQVELDQGGLPARPSWSPDGTMLVVSDGLRLLLWLPGGGDPEPIPGTEHGVYPAWSPAGDYIAYTRLLSDGVREGACACPGVEQRRITHRPAGRELVLVRPDGGEARVLGSGSEPAWSADGSTLYFRDGGRLWRRALPGGEPEPLSGTEGGRDPAPSPDGRALAFSRPGPAGTHDIWVVELP